MHSLALGPLQPGFALANSRERAPALVAPAKSGLERSTMRARTPPWTITVFALSTGCGRLYAGVTSMLPGGAVRQGARQARWGHKGEPVRTCKQAWSASTSPCPGPTAAPLRTANVTHTQFVDIQALHFI